MGFLRVFGAVVLILLGFAAFFLGFLIAPFILLVLFYLYIQASDRRKADRAASEREQVAEDERREARAVEEPA